MSVEQEEGVHRGAFERDERDVEDEWCLTPSLVDFIDQL